MSNRIKYLRERAGLSQERLAKKIHLSRQTIGFIEANKEKVSKENVELIANYFEVPLDYLYPKGSGDKYLSELLKEIVQSLLNNDLEKALQQSKKIEESIINPTQELSASLVLGALFYKERNLEAVKKVERFLSMFLDESKINEQSKEIQKHYYLYSFYKYGFEGNLQKCLEIGEILLTFSDDEVYRSQINLELVSIYLDLGTYDVALRLINEIIEIIKKYNNALLLSQAYIKLSRTYGKIQSYDKCLETLLLLENLTENHNLVSNKMVIAQHRGYIYSQKRDWEKSLCYYEEAFDYPKSPEREVAILNSLLYASLKSEDKSKAEKYLKLAQNHSLTPKEAAIFLSYKGELHLLNGETNLYIKCQEKAISYFKANNYISNLEYIYTLLAKYYHKIGQYKQASYYFYEREMLNEND